MLRKRNRAKQAGKRVGDEGYSLLEILVALAIIGALTALIAPRLIGQVDRSKTVTARAQVKMLKTSIETMRIDIGRYPTAEEGLSLLVEPTASDPLWSGPYLDGELPLDPWGRPYLYAIATVDSRPIPRIYTLGADGEPGGEGLDEDIQG